MNSQAAGGFFHRQLDPITHRLELLEHIPAPNAQHAKAILRQLPRPKRIMLPRFLAAMHLAIELDDEPCVVADEIDNIWPDGSLPLEARRVVVEEIIPEMALGRSHGVAKVLGTRLCGRTIAARHVLIIAFFGNTL